MNQYSNQVLVERDPSPMKLDVLNVEDWPVITQSVGDYPYDYAETETSFIIEGAGEIIVEGDPTVTFSAGDLITVLPDTHCVWNITEAIERYYYKG